MTTRRTTALAPLAAVLFAAAGCGAPSSPAPTATSTEPLGARDELTDDEMTRLRASLPALRAGMTRDEVFAAIDVSLDGLGQLGTGPTQEATTLYAIGHSAQLDLTWDLTYPEHPVLVRAAIVERE